MSPFFEQAVYICPRMPDEVSPARYNIETRLSRNTLSLLSTCHPFSDLGRLVALCSLLPWLRQLNFQRPELQSRSPCNALRRIIAKASRVPVRFLSTPASRLRHISKPSSSGLRTKPAALKGQYDHAPSLTNTTNEYTRWQSDNCNGKGVKIPASAAGAGDTGMGVCLGTRQGNWQSVMVVCAEQ